MAAGLWISLGEAKRVIPSPEGQRKGVQSPDLTGKEEEAGQPADGSCSLGTACSQAFQDREFTLQDANCHNDDTNLVYH